MIGILNIGFGNIKSVKNSVNFSNIKKEKIIYINKKKHVKKCRRIIIPGHGHFKNTINKLKKINIIKSIINKKKTKILGICIGLQMLCLFNNEGYLNGFGVIPENVNKFKPTKNFNVPNIGWRKVSIIKKNILIKKSSDFYFAHSFFIKPCPYTVGINKEEYFYSSIIIKNNFYLVQFHPEKSGINGIKLIKNFLK